MKRFTHLISLVLVVLLSSHNLFAADISGKVLYFGDNNKPVAKVTVNLIQKNKIIKTDLTESDGIYEFTDIAPGKYTISCTTNISSRQPTYWDATLVILNIFNVIQLSNMQIMAADVDGNNKIN